MEAAETELLTLLQNHTQKGKCPLAGNSVGQVPTVFTIWKKISKYSFCFKIKRILILKCNIKKEKMQFNEELTISAKKFFSIIWYFPLFFRIENFWRNACPL